MEQQGTIKWFSCQKGYGFIETTESDDEIFVHYSAIDGDGYRKLRHGDLVVFQMKTASKGPQAVEVRRIPKGS